MRIYFRYYVEDIIIVVTYTTASVAELELTGIKYSYTVYNLCTPRSQKSKIVLCFPRRPFTNFFSKIRENMLNFSTFILDLSYCTS